jgi:phenylacetate-CoA ligase
LQTKLKARNVTYANRKFNQMSEEEIKDYQEQLLRKQLKYVHRNSQLYRRKFEESGAFPEDIQTIEDFQKLPIFMDKIIERASQQESMERFDHPFGMHLCSSPDEIVFTGTTSGTSGVPTFTYTFTQADIEFLNRYIRHKETWGRFVCPT